MCNLLQYYILLKIIKTTLDKMNKVWLLYRNSNMIKYTYTRIPNGLRERPLGHISISVVEDSITIGKGVLSEFIVWESNFLFTHNRDTHFHYNKC